MTRPNDPMSHSAAAGAAVSKGRTRRQSKPANSASNWAGSSRITPFLIAGQVKLLSSSRLYAITNPLPSQ